MENDRLTNPELEDRPLHFLETFISKKFEGDPLSWKEASPEVILSKLKEVGETITERLIAKVRILKFIQENSVHDLLEDPLRSVYSVDILNNHDQVFQDTDHMPYVGALELAYFIQQMRQMGALTKPENAPYEFKKVCSFVLAEEGYQEPPFPFVFLSKEDLYPRYMKDEIPETDKELQANKQKAIDQYLKLMSRLDQ